MNTKPTIQAMRHPLTTTGAVTVERAWSGTGAREFAAPSALSHRAGIRFSNSMNDGTDLTPELGTRAWSPPV